MEINGKVVVITGSTRGIGLAMARACAAKGAKIVISSRRENLVKEVVNSLSEKGYTVVGIPADVEEPADLEKLKQYAIEKYGKIDVWINNAGLSGGYRYIDEISEEEISKIITVNITGTIFGCRLIIPYFIKNNGGIVINLGGMGSRGEVAPYLAVYAATKSAVSSITRSLAKEYKKYPVSINSFIPGMVATDFFSDMKIGPKLESKVNNIGYARKAFEIPINKVGEFITRLITQKPGKTTGKQYSLLKGFRLFRGIILISWFGMTGKLK